MATPNTTWQLQPTTNTPAKLNDSHALPYDTNWSFYSPTRTHFSWRAFSFPHSTCLLPFSHILADYYTLCAHSSPYLWLPLHFAQGLLSVHLECSSSSPHLDVVLLLVVLIVRDREAQWVPGALNQHQGRALWEEKQRHQRNVKQLPPPLMFGA